MLIGACRIPPAELGAAEPIRRGMRSVFKDLNDEELADMGNRAEIALPVPVLRAAMLDQSQT